MKRAAIWWRVSTAGQTDLSPDTQQGACKKLAQEDGFFIDIEHIFGAIWSSMDDLSVKCPEFKSLIQAIEERAICRLYVYDRDRLAADWYDRVGFFRLCRKYGVEVRVVQGPDFLDDSDFSDIMEVLQAKGKHTANERARKGAIIGLRERAIVKRLPTTKQPIFGYDWIETGASFSLEGNEHLEAARIIYQLALEGRSIRSIAKELTAHRIQAPRGPEWIAPTVKNFLHNPAYAGRYHALRYKAREPKNRKVASSRLSSIKLLPRDQWEYLPEIAVNPPVVSWSQWESIQERLVRNKEYALARQSTKRAYLLQGRIRCGVCGARYYAKNGFYSCKNRVQRFREAAKCQQPHLKSESIEDAYRNFVVTTLTNPKMLIKFLDDTSGDNVEDLKSKLDNLQKHSDKLDHQEAKLGTDFIKETLSKTALSGAVATLNIERDFVSKETERVTSALAMAEDKRATLERVFQLSANLKQFICEGATSEQWEEMQNMLDFQLVVESDGYVTFYLSSTPLRDVPTVNRVSR